MCFGPDLIRAIEAFIGKSYYRRTTARGLLFPHKKRLKSINSRVSLSKLLAEAHRYGKVRLYKLLVSLVAFLSEHSILPSSLQKATTTVTLEFVNSQ
jgi:hypothetical protein